MNQNLTLAFPSEWISWHSLVFPKGRQWRAALPFALEDKLASDVQQLRVIPVGSTSSGMGQVAVVAQQDLDRFSEQHPQHHAIWTPDFMRLPWQQAQATEALQQQTQALLKVHFPEVKRWVNPLAQAKTLAKERLAVQAQLQSSPLVALSRIDAQLVNAPAVSQVKLTAGRIELSWNSPLADAVLSRSITLAGWQAQWLNPQQLLLTVQGDQP